MNGAPCEAQLPGDGPDGKPVPLRRLDGIPPGFLARRGSPLRRVQLVGGRLSRGGAGALPPFPCLSLGVAAIQAFDEPERRSRRSDPGAVAFSKRVGTWWCLPGGDDLALWSTPPGCRPASPGSPPWRRRSRDAPVQAGVKESATGTLPCCPFPLCVRTWGRGWRRGPAPGLEGDMRWYHRMGGP